tara:strand:+ start:312 stop:1997 length:1686 start_codon:yes stop_codon:yes gene_type:complete
MENVAIALITLGGLFSIYEQENKKANKIVEKFIEKPCDTQNQLVEKKESLDSVPSKIDLKSKNDMYTTLSGEKMSLNDFKHNNMVHYYGGKDTGKIAVSSRSDSILDNMIGSGSTSFNKKCQGPLFKPQENINWIHGAPNNSDFIKERMSGNITTKRNNEKPWISENIGPGLTNSYDKDGTHGFNAGIMARDKWAPKTVDDLRTVNNPKLSFNLDDHMGPPSSIIQNRADAPNMKQYKPDTYFNNGPARFFTNVTSKKPMEHSEILMSNQNRETTNIDYKGIPTNGAYPTASKSDQNFDISKEHIYGEIKGGPGQGSSNMLENPYLSYSNKDTYRSKNNSENLYGNIQGVANMIGGINPLLDTIKPTRKEETIENLQRDGNISKIGAGGQLVYDPNDILKSTLREKTNYSVADNNIRVKDEINLITGQDNSIDVPDTNREHTSTYNVRAANGGTYGFRDHNIINNQQNNNNKNTRSWAPAGNTNILSHNINIKNIKQKEQDVMQRRQNVPNYIRDVMPNKEQIGLINMPKEVYNDVNDRINPTLLNAFKENPYTHSLSSAI